MFCLAARCAEASAIAAGFTGSAYADGDNNNPAIAVSQSANVSWVETGLGAPLSASVSASSGGFNAYAGGTATWDASGDSVAITMDYGNSVNGAPDNVSGDVVLGMNWFCEFTADQTGLLKFNYDTFSTGDTFSHLARRIPDLKTCAGKSAEGTGTPATRRTRIDWTFDRKAARRQFRYKRKSIGRSETW